MKISSYGYGEWRNWNCHCSRQWIWGSEKILLFIYALLMSDIIFYLSLTNKCHFTFLLDEPWHVRIFTFLETFPLQFSFEIDNISMNVYISNSLFNEFVSRRSVRLNYYYTFVALPKLPYGRPQLNGTLKVSLSLHYNRLHSNVCECVLVRLHRNCIYLTLID